MGLWEYKLPEGNQISIRTLDTGFELHHHIHMNTQVGKVNMELQLDATITVLLISKISKTCFGQTFAHLQEHKT
jgi:hypothetical protein